jgi:hypothetical protein
MCAAGTPLRLPPAELHIFRLSRPCHISVAIKDEVATAHIPI